jgi:hypothetical protein
MSKVEFLQMVPALLFGISMAELALFLGKASKGKGKLYWEHLVLIAISFETIIFNWYIFYDRITNIEASYLNFVIQLLSPLASFIYVANLLLENNFPDAPAEKYFQENRKRIFLSLGLFVVINAATVIYYNRIIDMHLAFLPLIPISVILINAFYDLKSLRVISYIVKCIQVILVFIFYK